METPERDEDFVPQSPHSQSGSSRRFERGWGYRIVG
jgi:hypothetical protein